MQTLLNGSCDDCFCKDLWVEQQCQGLFLLSGGSWLWSRALAVLVAALQQTSVHASRHLVSNDLCVCCLVRIFVNLTLSVIALIHKSPSNGVINDCAGPGTSERGGGNYPPCSPRFCANKQLPFVHLLVWAMTFALLCTCDCRRTPSRILPTVAAFVGTPSVAPEGGEQFRWSPVLAPVMRADGSRRPRGRLMIASIYCTEPLTALSASLSNPRKWQTTPLCSRSAVARRGKKKTQASRRTSRRGDVHPR